MPHFPSQEELQRTAPAETATFASPVPTQSVSNGEFNPLPQTREQERVEARIKDLAELLAPIHGMDRRRFLASTAGMAAAFLAMNEIFGPIFDVSRAEAQTPGVADRRADGLASQFIFDDQVRSRSQRQVRSSTQTVFLRSITESEPAPTIPQRV